MPRRLVTFTLAAIFFAAVASGAGAAGGDASHDFTLVNGERAANGLPAMVWASDLAQLAQQHANDMAAQQQLYHQSLNPIDGQAVAENVGVGATVDEIHSMFMQSPKHRANILGSYTDLGVGVALGSDGNLYVDELFRLPWSSAPATAPAPAPDPAPATDPIVTPAAAEPAAAVEPGPTTTEAPTTTSTTEPGTTTSTATTIPVTELATVPVVSVRVPHPIPIDDHRGLTIVAAACILGVVWMQLWSVATARTR